MMNYEDTEDTLKRNLVLLAILAVRFKPLALRQGFQRVTTRVLIRPEPLLRKLLSPCR